MDSFHQLFLRLAISFLICTMHVHSSSHPTTSMHQRYRQWMAEHNKIYPTDIESEERFQIFKKNVEYIDAFNSAGNTSYTLGLNQFTDLTIEEHITRFTGAYKPRAWNVSETVKPKNINLQALPKSWDWRKKGAVTPVKFQTCDDCWLFAGVAEVESVNFIATGKLYVLSEQEILDCDLEGKGGCNGGWEQEVYEYVKKNSLTTEANYPNNPGIKTCDMSKKSKERVARVSTFENMPPYSSDEELMQVVMKQPVVVGIDIRNPALTSYKSGVFTGPCGSDPNHVLQIVGFGETPEGLKYWIGRNSWGSGWGEGGYIRILRGTGVKEGICGFNFRPSYAVY